MDVVAKPERWALHRAGGVVALAFLMIPLTVCGPGPASGAQEIPPKGVAAGGPEPVSKSQKQFRDWVAAGIQGGFIKPNVLSIVETDDEMIWSFRSPTAQRVGFDYSYPPVIEHQIDVESIRLSQAPAERRALWEPYLQRMERVIADQLQYGIVSDAEDVFDLRLMSPLNDVSGIPTEGKNLIIVAAVNNVLHFRIFDDDGKVVVDTDEKRVPSSPQLGLAGRAPRIEDLREQLKSLWPPHELTRGDKGQVITAVSSIFWHIQMIQSDMDDNYSKFFDKILDEAMAATAKAAGKRSVSEDKRQPGLVPAGLSPRRRGGMEQAPAVMPVRVVLTTAGGQGLIFIAPKTVYLIAQRTGEVIPFRYISPGDRFNRIGAYVYKIRYPDARETPLRFIDIRASGTYRLQ